MKTNKEYIIHGIKPKDTYESILYTKAKTLEEAEIMKDYLTEKYHIKNARIQIINFDNDLANDWKNLLNN